MAASTMLGLLVAAGVAVWVLTRHTDEAVSMARSIARHIPVITEPRAATFIETMALRIRELLADPKRLIVAVILASANWLLDAAALWLVLAAFGHPVAVGPLLTVYGLGSIIAILTSDRRLD